MVSRKSREQRLSPGCPSDDGALEDGGEESTWPRPDSNRRPLPCKETNDAASAKAPTRKPQRARGHAADVTAQGGATKSAAEGAGCPSVVPAEHGPGWELRCGPWQQALADVEMVDAVICDPPYSARTHDGHNGAEEQMRSVTGQATIARIEYASWGSCDVFDFVESWAPRCAGWLAALTSDDLAPAWRLAFTASGFLSFAPIPVIQKRPRLLGDGPSSWTVWLMVARPRTRAMATWGCLPGAYEAPTERLGIVAGAKPIGLMRAIVRDYSRPGDLVVDPCAGGGTTLLAAAMEGRHGLGAELDPATFAKAAARLRAGIQPDIFGGAA